MTVPEIAALMARDRVAARGPLDTALRALHGSGRSRDLCALHQLAAEYWRDDLVQAAFHRTHAYVYALEAGDTQAESVLFDALAADARM